MLFTGPYVCKVPAGIIGGLTNDLIDFRPTTSFRIPRPDRQAATSGRRRTSSLVVGRSDTVLRWKNEASPKAPKGRSGMSMAAQVNVDRLAVMAGNARSTETNPARTEVHVSVTITISLPSGSAT